MNAAALEARDPGEVYRRLGELTRSLHDALRGLGYDRALENAVNSLPDTRARLAYVARLTGEAAEKVLDRVDHAQAEQDALAGVADRLAGELMNDPGRALASGRVMNMVEATAGGAERTKALLTEIMLAQDFHDLTNQVIGRLVDIVQSVETQLLQLLVDTAPPMPVAESGPASGSPPAISQVEAAATLEQCVPQGPVVDSSRRSDVVTSQGQVDDLLESLGF